MIAEKKLYTSLDKNEYWRRSSLEVVLCNILNPVLSLISIGICLLPRYGILPYWVVFLINLFLASQIALIVHELTHEPDSKTRWNWLLRLNIHATSPFIFGFDEYKRMHLLHHMNTNQDEDPDYFMVKGGKLRSFICLAFAHEYWFFYALRHRQTQPGFLPLYIARLAILFAYIYIVGFANYFFLFFLTSKLSYGLSFFVFSHESHTNEDGLREGSYNLKARFPFIHKLLKLLIGSYAYHIAHVHGTHHKYPWVSGRKLGLLTEKAQREGIDLPSRQLMY